MPRVDRSRVGRAVGPRDAMVVVPIAGGALVGARSRSVADYGSTARKMRLCAFLAKPFTSDLCSRPGALRRELFACLWTGRALRVP